jgi:hypothetical protein
MREITAVPSGPRPGTRYYRSIEGADFSLEANTENVPRDGRYYVLQDGKITFSSNQLGDARELYEQLCDGYWRTMMASSDRKDRIAAARGVLSHVPDDAAALAELSKSSDTRDQRTAATARQRIAYRNRTRP